MAIVLNHTIVPAHDKGASAEWFARIYGLVYEGAAGHFAPVKVNDTLTLDFDNADRFDSYHYALHVGDKEFDEIFARVQAEGISMVAGLLTRRTFRLMNVVAAEDFTSRTQTGIFWSYSLVPNPTTPRGGTCHGQSIFWSALDAGHTLRRVGGGRH